MNEMWAQCIWHNYETVKKKANKTPPPKKFKATISSPKRVKNMKVEVELAEKSSDQWGVDK